MRGVSHGRSDAYTQLDIANNQSIISRSCRTRRTLMRVDKRSTSNITILTIYIMSYIRLRLAAQVISLTQYISELIAAKQKEIR